MAKPRAVQETGQLFFWLKKRNFSIDILSYIYYTLIVYEIETTGEFDAWLHNLRDVSMRGFIGVINAKNKEI